MQSWFRAELAEDAFSQRHCSGSRTGGNRQSGHGLALEIARLQLKGIGEPQGWPSKVAQRPKDLEGGHAPCLEDNDAKRRGWHYNQN